MNSPDYEKRLQSTHMQSALIPQEHPAADTWLFIIILRKTPHPSKWKSNELS